MSDSKAKQLALALMVDILKSIDVVVSHSLPNIEKEWACFPDNKTSQSPRRENFKFHDLRSYDAGNELLDDVTLVLQELESKINSLIQ